MKEKKNFKSDNFLTEAEQAKIFGGFGENQGPELTINLGKKCKTWADCKKYCQPQPDLPAPSPRPIDTKPLEPKPLP